MLTLNDVCTLITDGSHYSPEDSGVGYPMLSVKDMCDDHFDFSDCKHVGEEDFQKLVANGCRPCVNDIVVAKDGSYLKTAFSIKEEQDIALLSSIAILRPKMDVVVPDYLSYYLKSESVYRTVSLNYISGTALKRIILKGIKKIPIKLPSIAEQRHRVDLLNGLQRVIKYRRQELQKLDELIKARFIEMFGDMESNPKSWRTSTLGDECYYIKDGPHKSPKYLDGTDGIPFISTRNVVNGDGIDWSTAKYISEADYLECIKKCHPEKGDILYSKGGTTGVAKLVDTDIRFANWVHVAVLKFGDQLDGRFLECMLNMDYCYAQSQALTKGIANRDFVLSAIAQVKIYVPPIDLQRQYTEFVKQSDKSKVIETNALVRLQYCLMPGLMAA